jgi:hypothetical protein
MDQRHNPAHGIPHDDGHAIGELQHQEEAGLVRNQGIRPGQLRAACHLSGSGYHVGSMHLPGRDDERRVPAHGTGHQPSVGNHPPGIILHREADIQGVVWSETHSPVSAKSPNREFWPWREKVKGVERDVVGA